MPLKVLILCYDFPPLNSAGSHRIKGWIKYLNKYDVYPIIVTRKWDREIQQPSDYDYDESGNVELEENTHYTVFRIPYKKSSFERMTLFFRKNNLSILSKAFTLAAYFIKHLPKINIEKNFYFSNVYDSVNKQKPDLILVSGEPFILFKYAHLISAKSKIPYALDYRDGWSTNFGKKEGILKLIAKIESFFEKKYLKNALFVSTAAQLIKEDLYKKFRTDNVFVVENGANLELINSINSKNTDHFEIIYTGTVYNSHNIDAFLKAFEQFITLRDYSAVVRFIGINFNENKHNKVFDYYASKYPENIKIIGKVTQETAIKWQKEATVLLKFCSAPITKGFYGAKLYEYASLNKPILTVAGKKEHAKTDFFEKEEIQTLVYNEETCLAALFDLYKDFTSGKLKNKQFLSPEQIQSISCENQVSVLAGEIKERLNDIVT